MNSTQSKAKSRIAAKLGLVAAPRGYVTPYENEMINLAINRAAKRIAKEMETKK